MPGYLKGECHRRDCLHCTDGRLLYVRLWSNLGGNWQASDATYTADGGTKGTLTSPTPGSVLPGTSVTFTWTGAGVSDYQLYVGSSLGAGDLYMGDEKTNLSKTVAGLPTDGRTLDVRLWSNVSGTWQSSDAIYTAATQ